MYFDTWIVCFSGVFFYGLYHGKSPFFHHHLGKYVFFTFSKHQTSKSKDMKTILVVRFSCFFRTMAMRFLILPLGLAYGQCLYENKVGTEVRLNQT